jgi:hypothetical protein
MSFFTYQDAVLAVSDYIGASDDRAIRDAKRAVIGAYKELANARRWTYLIHHGRIITNAPYVGDDALATIQYQATAGTYPRQVTLTGGVFPSWVAGGYMRVGPVAFRIAQRISDTILTLDEQVCPSADLPVLTSFIIYQDTYLLPADYISQDQALFEMNFGSMTFSNPQSWLFTNRYVLASGIPQAFTITGDPQYPGRLVFRCYPWPNSVATIDFLYVRRPRALSISVLGKPGLASITGGTNVVTLASPPAGFQFTPGMVGSVIRLSSLATLPTSEVGDNPPALESVIVAWTSGTSVVVADTYSGTLAGVGYIVSDPIDIEQGSMLNAFNRCCEKHVGIGRVMKDKPSANKQYLEELEKARSADSRSFAMRSVGDAGCIPRMRLRDMPMDFNTT